MTYCVSSSSLTSTLLERKVDEPVRRWYEEEGMPTAEVLVPRLGSVPLLLPVGLMTRYEGSMSSSSLGLYEL